MPDQLAIVEDDDAQRSGLEQGLDRRGFCVDAYGDRPSARRAFRAGRIPELAILDVNLSGDDPQDRDGFELCRELHEIPRAAQVPVIFLTRLEDVPDRLTGLTLAVAYLGKPVDLDLLAAQVRSLLAWSRRFHGALRDEERPLVSGPLRVDPGASRAAWKGRALDLTYSEFQVLECLAARPGRVATYLDLCEALGNHVADNTIATHIQHLRGKFVDVDPDFPRAAVISSVPRKGYRWEPPPEDA